MNGEQGFSKEKGNLKEKGIIGGRPLVVSGCLPDQDPFVLSPALLTFEIAYQEHKSAANLTKEYNRTHNKQHLRRAQLSAVNNALLCLT